MPNCFQLINKKTGLLDNLQDIDNLLWINIGKRKPLKNIWYLDWYNYFGLDMAMGKSFDDIIDRNKDDNEFIEILEYLKENYNINAWAER